MRIKPRFLIGGALIVGVIAYLIVTSIRNTAEYYLTVPEAAARQSELGAQSLRIAGRVRPDAVSWDPATLTLSFSIGSIPDSNHPPIERVAGASDPVITVVCIGQPKPDMFAPGRDVIVEGRWSGPNAIAASQVLTSCPSKYSAKQAN
ncbi:MAG TPA: cytochrome c maturation protein CcmE [Candidatus Binataceae bacterium]